MFAITRPLLGPCVALAIAALGALTFGTGDPPEHGRRAEAAAPAQSPAPGREVAMRATARDPHAERAARLAESRPAL